MIIAVVGLSNDPTRPSYQVATYMRERGYTIIPINPSITHWNGITSYPSLGAVLATTHVDIVDVFRKSDAVLGIVREVLATGQKPVIWMQEGVESAQAKTLAESAGLCVVMDTCIMKEYKKLSRNDDSAHLFLGKKIQGIFK